MTKFREIHDEKRRTICVQYIEGQVKEKQKWRSESLQRLNGYLFSLNAGALLASLTYVAAKSDNADIMRSIWFFAFGIIFCIIHAAVDYYSAERAMVKHSSFVDSYFKNKLTWNVFIDKCSSIYNRKLDIVLHIIGWGSGLSFLSGLIYGINQLK